MFTPAEIAFASLTYSYKKIIGKSVLKNQLLVNLFKSMNIFDGNFWKKDIPNKLRSNIKVLQGEIKKNIIKIKNLQNKVDEEMLKQNYYLKTETH